MESVEKPCRTGVWGRSPFKGRVLTASTNQDSKLQGYQIFKLEKEDKNLVNVRFTMNQKVIWAIKSRQKFLW